MAGPPNSVAISSPLPNRYFGEVQGAAAAIPTQFQQLGHVQPNVAEIFPSSPLPVINPPGPIATAPITTTPGHRPGGIPIPTNPLRVAPVPPGAFDLQGILKRAQNTINNLGRGNDVVSRLSGQLRSFFGQRSAT